MAVKVVAIVQYARMYAPPPSSTVNVALEVSTVDGKKVGTAYVAIPFTASQKDMSSAIETAIKAHCTSAGIVIAANEVLLVNEPMWRMF